MLHQRQGPTSPRPGWPRGLTARGVSVLRVDLTGLGESGSEFAESTFFADVDDLVRAAADDTPGPGARSLPPGARRSRRVRRPGTGMTPDVVGHRGPAGSEPDEREDGEHERPRPG